MDSYSAGNLTYRRAAEQDDADLRAMLRANAMDSWVTLTLEREPSYFSGENLMGNSIAVIAHEAGNRGRTIGMYSCAFLPVHRNGRPEQVGYLGGLRVNCPYRHMPRIVRNGFASIPHLVPESSTVSSWFTSISSENSAARRLLEARLKGMPVYRPEGEMETLAISVRQGRASTLLQQATLDDVPALSDFFNRQSSAYQFSPVLTEAWLRGLSGKSGLRLSDFWLLKEGQDMRGCIAVWDQRAFKQTVARRYRFPLDMLRGTYNLWAAASGRVRLPAAGKPLEHAFLAFVAFDTSADNVVLDAIREGVAKVGKKGAQAGVLGLSVNNPLLSKLKGAIPASVYRTCIETVVFAGQPMPEFCGYLPQPEVAIL